VKFKSSPRPHGKAETEAKHYADPDRPAGFTYPVGRGTLFVTFPWLLGPSGYKHTGIPPERFELLNRADLYDEIPDGLHLVRPPL